MDHKILNIGSIQTDEIIENVLNENWSQDFAYILYDFYLSNPNTNFHVIPGGVTLESIRTTQVFDKKIKIHVTLDLLPRGNLFPKSDLIHFKTSNVKINILDPQNPIQLTLDPQNPQHAWPGKLQIKFLVASRNYRERIQNNNQCLNLTWLMESKNTSLWNYLDNLIINEIEFLYPNI